jgi:ABC-type amino acid transport substrate-binding protein
VRKEDAELKAAINQAIANALKSGKIAAALHHYGVPFYPAK